MSDLRLSIAVGDYLHVRHLVDGRVHVPGLELTWVQLPIEQILQRAFLHGEWDVSEFSLAQYVALRSEGRDHLVAIPVFPSRVFRHGSIYVRRGEVDTPEGLRGARIGVPEWVQTAGVWTRGMLADDYGLRPADVEWVQGGLHSPGRAEHMRITLPHGVRIRAERERTLQDLLLAGDIDAVITARPPSQATPKGPIVPLFRNHRALELSWGRRVRFVPIMHLLVMRRDVYDRARWAAAGLLDAFEEAKSRALAALADLTVSQVPVPWVGEEFRRLADLFPSDEWWPYNVPANRNALETFLRYAAEQGVAAPGLQVDDLFAPETLTQVQV
jgi:4,5-dihydroxyphthalate decarboxylase